MFSTNITEEGINELINKLIDGGIEIGGRILGAIIIFLIGKMMINWANKLFAKMLEKRKVDASIQSFLKSIVNITLFRTEAVSCIHSGFKKLSAFNHIEKFVFINVIVPIVLALCGGIYGCIAEELFKIIAFFEKLSSNLCFTGSGRTYKRNYGWVFIIVLCRGIACRYYFNKLYKLIVIIYREHTRSALIPRAAHKDGICSV